MYMQKESNLRNVSKFDLNIIEICNYNKWIENNLYKYQ